MDTGARRAHWEQVYRTKVSDAVSWYQAEPAQSLALLHAAGLTRDSCIIDVGGGDSLLVDRLIAGGLTCLTVLDISAAALARARERLGAQAAGIRWLEADVTGDWTAPPQDFWHDRAVFHFLTDARDRAAYVQHLRDTLKPGGVAVIATFAPAGPTRCSGLPTERYSPDALGRELGADFQLIAEAEEEHRTPGGSRQAFVYSTFRFRAR